MGGCVAPSISIPHELPYSWSIEGEAQSASAFFVSVTK
jgi:hypothetical protein